MINICFDFRTLVISWIKTWTILYDFPFVYYWTFEQLFFTSCSKKLPKIWLWAFLIFYAVSLTHTHTNTHTHHTHTHTHSHTYTHTHHTHHTHTYHAFLKKGREKSLSLKLQIQLILFFTANDKQHQYYFLKDTVNIVT